MPSLTMTFSVPDTKTVDLVESALRTRYGAEHPEKGVQFIKLALRDIIRDAVLLEMRLQAEDAARSAVQAIDIAVS